jgi:hypothetical protein
MFPELGPGKQLARGYHAIAALNVDHRELGRAIPRQTQTTGLAL